MRVGCDYQEQEEEMSEFINGMLVVILVEFIILFVIYCIYYGNWEYTK